MLQGEGRARKFEIAVSRYKHGRCPECGKSQGEPGGLEYREKSQDLFAMAARNAGPLWSTWQLCVMTDGHAGYNGLTGLGYRHEVVPHSQGIYVLGKDIHTNTIKDFWSQLKRSIDGSYHHVSTKYLPLYVDENAFRYTHRKDEQNMFWTMMERVISEAS